MQETTSQEGGRPAACSFRTRWSGCVLTGECHLDYFLVVQVKYWAASHEQVVQRMNEVQGSAIPLDVPIDLAAALMSFKLIDTDKVIELLGRPDEDFAAYLKATVAVLRGNADLDDFLLRVAGDQDPAKREVVAFVAHKFDRLSVLRSMLAGESDPNLRAKLAQVVGN
jgi:hypothetical protein